MSDRELRVTNRGRLRGQLDRLQEIMEYNYLRMTVKIDSVSMY